MNIQRDLVSRDRISNSIAKPVVIPEENDTEVEIVIITENAESEIVQEPANDESSEPTKKAKKGRRSSEGNV